MTIYLDIIFAENILMNYIILFATLVIIKAKNKYQQTRLLTASFIGSIYAIIIYLNILPIYSNIISKIVLSIVMTHVAFGSKNLKQLLKQLLTFYLVSFIFGGCTFALIYFLKPENVKIQNGVFVGLYPIKVAIIAGFIAFIITQIAFKINKAKLSSKNQIIKIEIYYEERKLKLNALLDSGNMLKDPISKTPTIIAEKSALYSIFPEEILNNIEQILGGDCNQKTEKYLSRIRMVPFMSIGKTNGMLIGLRTDKVVIYQEEQTTERKNVIVCIYNEKISKDNKYNALIGLNLLEGECENELATNFKK